MSDVDLTLGTQTVDIILDGEPVTIQLGEITELAQGAADDAEASALAAAGSAGAAAASAASAADEADRAETAADQAASARPYYATVAAGAAATSAPNTFLSDESGTDTLYDEAGNALYEPASRERLDRFAKRAPLTAILRGRQFRRKLGARNAYTSSTAPRAATITNASDYPAASGTWSTQLVQLTQNRRRVLSLTAAGAGAPNYCTVECEQRHGLVAGQRIRIGGTANTTTSGPSTQHNTVSYTSDGGQAPKTIGTLSLADLESGLGLKGINVYDVVDDFNFRVKQAALLPLSESGADLFWEPLATYWPMADAVFDWVIPGRREALPTNQHTNASLRPTSGVVSWGTPAGLGGATETATSKCQSVEFMFYGDQFQLAYVQGYYRVFADGEPVHNDQLNRNLITFPGGRDTYQFIDSRPRLIRIDVIGSPHHLFGIYTRGRADIGRVRARDQRRPLMVMCGDSFGEGSGAVHWHYSFAALMAERLGWDVVNGSLGGTGMTMSGPYASTYNYIGRMRLMKAAGIEPDVVCILHSVNDGTSVTRVNSTAFVRQLKALWPQAELIVLGRMATSGSAVSAGTTTADQAWQATCRDFDIPFLDGGIGSQGLPVWITVANRLTFYWGTAATATSAITGDAVTSVTVGTAGAGYDPAQGAPAVSFSGGAGTGAAATAVMAYTVTALEIISGGRDYTTATLTIGHGAVATAVVSGGAVISVAVTNSGMLFTAVPPITFSGGGGTGATATAVLEGGRLIGITITAGGSGYVSAPTVSIGISATDATATATITNGVITAVTITDPGSLYTDTPICTVTGDGYGAEIVPFISGTVASVSVTNGGSGYTGAPTVTIAHPHLGGSGDTTHPKSNGHRLLATHWARELEDMLAEE